MTFVVVECVSARIYNSLMSGRTTKLGALFFISQTKFPRHAHTLQKSNHATCLLIFSITQSSIAESNTNYKWNIVGFMVLIFKLKS